MAEDTSWVPTREIISAMEAQIVLPEGSHQLNAYARHYSGAVEGERRVVVGVLVAGQDDSNNPGSFNIYSHPHHLPMIFDGGCDIINLKYDMVANSIEVFCNGVA